MKQLTGKIVLITGGGRGIGRAVAELFATEGAELLLTARSTDELEQAAAAVEEAGGKCTVLPGDITDDAFVVRLFQEVRERFGRLDILINNAGAAPWGRIQDMPPAEMRRNLEVNLIAVYACMREAILLMEATTGTGKIINVGSVRSHWSMGGECGIYNASKYGLRGMTEAVARQFHGGKTLITIGMISPGQVDTRMTNPNGEPTTDWVEPRTAAEVVLHAVTAPPHVNIYDTIFFPIMQSPW